MTKRKKIFSIVLTLVVLLLILILLWLVWQKPGGLALLKTTNNTPPVSIENNVKTEETPSEVAALEPSSVESSLESLAATFAERYGSYSTESDFANLNDVMGLMTTTFKKETENFIASTKISSDYYGITTRVLSVKVVSLDEVEGTATIEVSTQQEESKGSPRDSQLRYQKLVLGFLEVDGVWKVGSAVWQKL